MVRYPHCLNATELTRSRAEAVCYFLNTPDGQASPHRAELEASLEETVDRIEKAIQPDGYLGIYFTVVDPKGRFMNLRDMHELCQSESWTCYRSVIDDPQMKSAI